MMSQSPDCLENIAPYIPYDDYEFVENRISFFSGIIIDSKKSILFMMLPETALLEHLAKSGWEGRAIVAIPNDLDDESKERIYANVPNGISTEFISEGTCPASFRPDNGVIICTGIVLDAYRQYILPSSCRMMSLYKMFQGERILLSCFPQGVKIPEIGWTYAGPDFFTQIIEEASYEQYNT